MEDNKRIFGLDVMRTIAIMLVIVGHFHWIMPPNNGIVSQFLLIFGFLGVEVFFVLSGFLIGKILLKLYLKDDYTLSSFFYFIKRRWYRTLPNYYLVLLINILIAFYIGYSIDNLGQYFFFFQNFCSPLTPFFSESWSLSVEEYAYLILPFSVLIFTLFFKPKNKQLFFRNLIVFLIFIFIGTKILYHYSTTNTSIDEWNTSLKSVVIYRLDAIFIGVLCGWISTQFTDFWKKNRMFFLAISWVLLAFIFVGVGYFRILIDSFPFYWNVFYLPVLSTAIALSLPFLSCWENHKSILVKPITFISKISYSMYLLHYSVIMQLLKYFFKTETLNGFTLLSFFLLYLGITIFLSSILYRFYEKPMMDLRDKN